MPRSREPHDRRYVREAATTALARLVLPPAEALAYFLPRLSDPSDAVRAAGLKRLSQLAPGDVSDADLSAVQRQLSDHAWKVREAAVVAIRQLQPSYLASHPKALAQLLTDEVCRQSRPKLPTSPMRPNPRPGVASRGAQASPPPAAACAAAGGAHTHRGS